MKSGSANLNSPKSKLSGGGDTIPPIKISKNMISLKYILAMKNKASAYLRKCVGKL